MRILWLSFFFSVDAFYRRTGPADTDCTGWQDDMQMTDRYDCRHEMVVEPHPECPPTFKGCFNATLSGAVDKYHALMDYWNYEDGMWGTPDNFTIQPTWGQNFSVLHCADWCRENAAQGCIGFLTDDLTNIDSYNYGVNYEQYDNSYDAKATCYLVTDPGCTEDLDPSSEYFGYAYHDMNDCNIPDKTELLDGECTGNSEWSEWIDSSPQSKIDRTGSERELISVLTSASFQADTNLGLCGQSDVLAAQAREVYVEAINATARDLIENGGNLLGGGGMEFNSRSARSITFEVLSFSKSVGLICNNADQFEGVPCSNYEMRVCCPITRSHWQAWGEWSDCSVTCDGGTSTRTRECDNAFPDSPCEGDSEQSAGCNGNLCANPLSCQCTVPASGSTWMFSCESTACPAGTRCYPNDRGETGAAVDGTCEARMMNTEKCQSHLDPYVWTFDSPKRSHNRLDVFGIGEYVLSQYLGNGDPNDVGFFKITIKTAAWAGYQTVSEINGGVVTIYLPNNVDFYTISFDMDRPVASEMTLTEGGIERTINSGEIREGLHEHYVKIRGWPEPYAIESWSGVKLQIMHQMFSFNWTPTGFNLYLARAYQGKIEGLCGNMNRNFADDFTLKTGEVLSISDSSTSYNYAKDWEVSCTANCRKRRDTDPWSQVTCDGQFTDSTCENLFVSSFFDECRAVLSPDDSIDICKLEYCLVEEPATINRIVENYMDNCRQILPYAESVCKTGSEEFYEDLLLEPDSNAPYQQCGENQEYSGCIKVSRDLRSCLDFRTNAPVMANEDTQVGCKCVSGFYLENNVCVAEADCPAYTGRTFDGFDTDGDGVGDGVLPGSVCNVQSALDSLIAVRSYINENAERGFYKRKKSFLRALDNAYYNKKKSKNGVKEPFGCAIAVDTTVPEESLANCAFTTSTGITETVQKTCDDLTVFLNWTFSDCKAGKDKKGSKAARKSVRKLNKKCKKFLKKLDHHHTH